MTSHAQSVRSRLLVMHPAGGEREALAGVLSRAGYAVDLACDPEEALALLEAGKVDALVLGVRLPSRAAIGLLNACPAPPPTVVVMPPGIVRANVASHPSVVATLTAPFAPQSLYDAVAKATGWLVQPT